jgi:hypothetical protein
VILNSIGRSQSSRGPNPELDNPVRDELADLYPAVAQKLVELLVRVAINDREVGYINNHALPKGADRLLVAEKARGLLGWVVNSIEAPRITDHLQLPPWQPRSNYLWPPRRY